MVKMDRIGIVCCSNGHRKENRPKLSRLRDVCLSLGVEPVFSPYLYADQNFESASAEERAHALMAFYRDDSIRGIFDISGGDIANTILPYLDYSVIRASGKKFFGYSDLTTVINAIYTKAGQASGLYQLLNLVLEDSEAQIRYFRESFLGQVPHFPPVPCEFYRGSSMEGILLGGNIRCFLKLAGTEYFPDMEGKLLLLEANKGRAAQLLTYFAQLEQLGVFEKISGILLGTFTQLEKERDASDAFRLLQRFLRPETPVAKTPCIGHASSAQAIILGSYHRFG